MTTELRSQKKKLIMTAGRGIVSNEVALISAFSNPDHNGWTGKTLAALLRLTGNNGVVAVPNILHLPPLKP